MVRLGRQVEEEVERTAGQHTPPQQVSLALQYASPQHVAFPDMQNGPIVVDCGMQQVSTLCSASA